MWNAGKKQKGMGLRLGDQESGCLTNLRFADDVLLLSTSLEQLEQPKCEQKESSGDQQH